MKLLAWLCDITCWSFLHRWTTESSMLKCPKSTFLMRDVPNLHEGREREASTVALKKSCVTSVTFLKADFNLISFFSTDSIFHFLLKKIIKLAPWRRDNFWKWINYENKFEFEYRIDRNNIDTPKGSSNVHMHGVWQSKNKWKIRACKHNCFPFEPTLSVWSLSGKLSSAG